MEAFSPRVNLLLGTPKTKMGVTTIGLFCTTNLSNVLQTEIRVPNLKKTGKITTTRERMDLIPIKTN